MPQLSPLAASFRKTCRTLAGWGPGLLVMLADCDAGNVVAAAQSGAQWGIRFLPLLLVLAVPLYMVQALCVRLGIASGRGYGALVRERFGRGWAALAAIALVVAVLSSLVTEFTGIAGIGEMYGVPRAASLSLAAALLLALVCTGSHERVDRVAMLIGLAELAFFAVAWHARPDWPRLAREARDWPLGHPQLVYLAAALIGASFNPWMIFYQQAAIADEQRTLSDERSARIETALGAVLTQALTGAVLVAAASSLSARAGSLGLRNVGEIAVAFFGVAGEEAGRFIFSVGVLGASLVAAIVCSLALAWGLSEVTGHRASLQARPHRAPWFYGVYAAAVAVSAGLVWLEPDLVSVNVAAQVVNALLLPFVVGPLIVLAIVALPAAYRLRGAYRVTVCLCVACVCVAGVAGAVAGWFA
ncbi:NRAMP family divalent metal transporter [Trinickia diaoshuihuensis]|uniref:NRAMP family divalent metal transporter n=1 Tax=Trinickia diaoshuihuensis TaxID=2292265 RepID=UPI000E2364BB|nr:divalent metal cation transporter [Trinickia diaoshuihuensis]